MDIGRPDVKAVALAACGAHYADRVMVDGRWVVERRRDPGLDLTARVGRHNAAAKALHAG